MSAFSNHYVALTTIPAIEYGINDAFAAQNRHLRSKPSQFRRHGGRVQTNVTTEARI